MADKEGSPGMIKIERSKEGLYIITAGGETVIKDMLAGVFNKIHYYFSHECPYYRKET